MSTIQSIAVTYTDGRVKTLDKDLSPIASFSRAIKGIKEGAKVNGLRPEILIAWDIAYNVYIKYGVDCILTEGTGGTHGIGSLHYVGLAIDLRTRDFKAGIAEEVKVELKSLLSSQYDVILESDHFHVEYQPK